MGLLKSTDKYEIMLIKNATRKDVINTFQRDEYDWFIWDEIQRTEKQPYEIVWAADDEGKTLVSYIQDFIVNMDYLLVRGENVLEIAPEVRSLFQQRIFTKEEILHLWSQAQTQNEKIKSIYQIGVSASSTFDPDIYAIFETLVNESDNEVRLAAVWSMSYIAWPQIQELVTQYAMSDSDSEVRDVAQALLQTYETGIGLGF
ncbi:HEAT repeat domain-containing protein [Cytophagaceae bacterium DM2B3-1]|uniref:HEAT repeat domain-containing protein n=1 Tax=Xanthocytophaga flava TaxID=3048013 RepID=A0ABT7CGS7_9BACT|nr:HEAT repeat domain-containing protein [Xanthocytophaga flavus]MDJ1471068.1 HEAT repeat domain-containing protein [Xanthocytophaga flavus]MDJ1492947.1 HEAT repeat domain-containing protein [Xanthocytophaga flavus]